MAESQEQREENKKAGLRTRKGKTNLRGARISHGFSVTFPVETVALQALIPQSPKVLSSGSFGHWFVEIRGQCIVPSSTYF